MKKTKIEITNYCRDCSCIEKLSDDISCFEAYHTNSGGNAILGYCSLKGHWVLLNRETCEKFNLLKKNV